MDFNKWINSDYHDDSTGHLKQIIKNTFNYGQFIQYLLYDQLLEYIYVIVSLLFIFCIIFCYHLLYFCCCSCSSNEFYV